MASYGSCETRARALEHKQREPELEREIQVELGVHIETVTCVCVVRVRRCLQTNTGCVVHQCSLYFLYLQSIPHGTVLCNHGGHWEARHGIFGGESESADSYHTPTMT